MASRPQLNQRVMAVDPAAASQLAQVARRRLRHSLQAFPLASKLFNLGHASNTESI